MIKRFDREGIPHINGQYADAEVAVALYEALERLQHECANDLSGAAVEFIRAALAKARGES